MASLIGGLLLWFDEKHPFRYKLELTVRQTFFVSQALALASVGTARLASAVGLSEVRQHTKWESASWVWSSVCGVWIVVEMLLATISCPYDETKGRFACAEEVSVMARGRAMGESKS
jgi:hypothetical protein